MRDHDAENHRLEARLDAEREEPPTEVHTFKCTQCGESYAHAWGEERASLDGLRIMHKRQGEWCGPIQWGWTHKRAHGGQP